MKKKPARVTPVSFFEQSISREIRGAAHMARTLKKLTGKEGRDAPIIERRPLG